MLLEYIQCLQEQIIVGQIIYVQVGAIRIRVDPPGTLQSSECIPSSSFRLGIIIMFHCDMLPFCIKFQPQHGSTVCFTSRASDRSYQLLFLKINEQDCICSARM